MITPPKKWIPVNLRELWNYRELLYSFTWRDVKIRYKQTALGFLWAIIQPLFMMLIFTVFFGRLAKIPSDGIPYPLFVLAALLPWTLFAEGITRSTIQHDHECQYHDQGLLPPADHAVLRDPVAARGLCFFVLHPYRHDGMCTGLSRP